MAPPATMPRVGVLELGTPPPSPEWKARALLVQELRQLGWLEGQNIVFEYRWAQGQPGRLSSLAAELVGLPVDVLVVSASPAIHAAQRATTTLPIVMVSVNDPVEDAIVADLARPGRNLCGQNPQGREARRFASGATHAIRARRQPQDRQGARPDDCSVRPLSSGHGHPMRPRPLNGDFV
jgi:ABC transporter substrate binding protein